LKIIGFSMSIDAPIGATIDPTIDAKRFQLAE